MCHAASYSPIVITRDVSRGGPTKTQKKNSGPWVILNGSGTAVINKFV